MVIAILAVMLAIVWFGFVTICYCHQYDKNAPRIKFKNFVSWYYINQDVWHRDSLYKVEKHVGFGKDVQVVFSFFGLMTLIVWDFFENHARNRNETNETRRKLEIELLESVQADIDKEMTRAHIDIVDGQNRLSEVLKNIKQV